MRRISSRMTFFNKRIFHFRRFDLVKGLIERIESRTPKPSLAHHRSD